jgi:hypothetical protein
MWNDMENMDNFHIISQFSSILSISFHNFLLYFPNLFTIQTLVSSIFSYLFTIQLSFLPYFPYLITIWFTFLPYFPYHFTIQPTFLPYFLYLFTIFFCIFQIVSLFDLPIQKKSKSNSEKIWKIHKKSRMNSEKIWKIQKKIVKR